MAGEVVEVFVRAVSVEPEHPFGGAKFHMVDVAPGALPADEFVLERSDGGLGQRVVPSDQLRSIPSLISELSG